MYYWTDIFCNECGHVEYLAHFLFYCQRFVRQRQSLINSLTLYGVTYNIHNLAIILGKDTGNTILDKLLRQFVVKYVIDSGRLDEFRNIRKH